MTILSINKIYAIIAIDVLVQTHNFEITQPISKLLNHIIITQRICRRIGGISSFVTIQWFCWYKWKISYIYCFSIWGHIVKANLSWSLTRTKFF